MKISKLFRFLFLAIVFVFVFAIFSVEIRDSDFWWHLKTGEYIYQTGALPDKDPFAYTSLAKDPLNPESKRIKFILKQYWLAQLFFYSTFQYFGFQGIIVLRAFLLTVLMLFVYLSIRREGIGPYLAVFLLIPVFIIFSSNFTGERPQLFSFLFSFLLIFCLEGFRRKALASWDQYRVISADVRYLLPVPVLTLLWANLHGGFFVGTVIILGYFFSETLKYFTKKFGSSLPRKSFLSFLCIGTISILVSFMNPNGYNVISILMELEQSRYRETIIEAMSPLSIGLSYADVFLFFFLLVLSLAVMVMNIRKLDITDIVIFSGLALMGLSAVRFIPFFAPVAILIVARYGVQMMQRPSWKSQIDMVKRPVGAVFAVLFSVMLVFMATKYDIFSKSGIRTDKYPEGAVRFLRDNRINGNMYNPYYWGGYLIWELYPDYKVFIDGRGLIEDIYFQYLNVFMAKSQMFEGLPEWKAVLQTYKVNFIVTFSVDKFTGNIVPLIPALYHDPEWHLVYMDKISLIFLRESPENEQLIQRFGMPKEWLWTEVVTEALVKAKTSPKKANFYITIGDAFFTKKSFMDARAAYVKAQETDPDNRISQERLQFLESYGY